MTLKSAHPQASLDDHKEQIGELEEQRRRRRRQRPKATCGDATLLKTKLPVARPVVSLVDHSYPSTRSMKHVHRNPRGQMMAAQRKSTIDLDNHILDTHMKSIGAGESKYRNPICPPGRVRHHSHAKFIAKQKEQRQRVIDRENEDMKSRIGDIASAYSAYFAGPTPPQNIKNSRQKSSPRPAGRSMLKSKAEVTSDAASNTSPLATTVVEKDTSNRFIGGGAVVVDDECMRCGIMKISGRFVEVSVSVGSLSKDKCSDEKKGISVEVYDPMLRETFGMELSSADEIPDFDSFLTAVSVASAAGDGGDADVLELLSRLTFTEDENGKWSLCMAGIDYRTRGKGPSGKPNQETHVNSAASAPKTEADIIAAAAKVIRGKTQNNASQLCYEEQKEERPVSPITLPPPVASSDDVESLREAIEALACESAAREAEIELLRQENLELRCSVRPKPWEQPGIPTLPPRTRIALKSPRRSPLRNER